MFVDHGNLRTAMDCDGVLSVGLLVAQRIGVVGALVRAMPAMADDVSGMRCR